MWHASIAWVRNHKPPRKTISWPAKIRQEAVEITRELLKGVGTGTLDIKDGDTALHVRIRLSDDEIANISPAWLAIPAIDGGHPEDSQ